MSGLPRTAGSTIFTTSIGHCGLAWSHDAIVATQLPEKTRSATAERLRRLANDGTTTDVLPGFIDDAVHRIQAVLAGAYDDLRDLELSTAGVPQFTARVRNVVRSIPLGETMTYGDVARQAGRPNGARAVGAAMGSNPLPIIVPCHRVVAASGKVGGFSAASGPELKLRMLHTERLANNQSPPASTWTTPRSCSLTRLRPSTPNDSPTARSASMRRRTSMRRPLD